MSLTSGPGVDAIDPVRRLSLLPSERNGWLVELGVMRGGNRVVFAVQPGTVVHGPGICTPGPIDCQILSLATGQIETASPIVLAGEASSVSSNSAQAAAPAPIRFAVTSIKTEDHTSVDAAMDVRTAESTVGRRLLNQSTSRALSLFHYDPSIGAIVDLRNVSVGGS